MTLQSTLAGLVGRLAPLLVLALVVAAPPARPQATIQSLTGVVEGHQVGGMAVDMVGNLYIADFGDIVWKLTPEGDRQVFVTGLYGSSGNAIDNQGNLLQSSYYGDFITRIDRKGQATPLVTAGLSGPVGLAVDRQTGDVYVANCRGNTVGRIAPDHSLSTFAKSELFRCPNGLALDGKGNLYVVNFRDNRMLKVDAHGAVALFATVSAKGLGHVCFRKDRLYVTAYETHEIYEVTLQGAVRRILGNGERGTVDGADPKARLSFPNGVACDPWAPRLYINEYLGDPDDQPPRRMIVREILLGPEAAAGASAGTGAAAAGAAAAGAAAAGAGTGAGAEAGAAGGKCCSVFELRQYNLKPGQRDVLVELFDREFVESQEALGMRIPGQFRDEDNPDHFVWVRGFSDMDARQHALAAFYGGPVWKAHAREANATMIDTDNVLLLHPVEPTGGFNDLPATRAAVGTGVPPASMVVATIYSLHPETRSAFPAFFQKTLRPILHEAGITTRATFETEHSPNTFPSLPVREGEDVFVSFASFGSKAGFDSSMERLSQSRAWTRIQPKLTAYLKSAPQQLHLQPTSRSLLQ